MEENKKDTFEDILKSLKSYSENLDGGYVYDNKIEITINTPGQEHKRYYEAYIFAEDFVCYHANHDDNNIDSEENALTIVLKDSAYIDFMDCKISTKELVERSGYANPKENLKYHKFPDKWQSKYIARDFASEFHKLQDLVRNRFANRRHRNHPSVFLEEIMEKMDLCIGDLSKLIKVNYLDLFDFLAKKSPITEEIAEGLYNADIKSVEYWINAQLKYDEYIKYR